MLAEWQNSKLWNLLSSAHTKSIIYWPIPFVRNPEASWEASVPLMCYETGHIRAGRKTWFAIITTPGKVPYNWEKNPSFKLSLGRGGKNWIICPVFWFFFWVWPKPLASVSPVSKGWWNTRGHWEKRWQFELAYSTQPLLLAQYRVSWWGNPRFQLLH